MRFDVRNPGGIKLGTVEVLDLRWLRSRTIRFARALDVRYYGRGFLGSDRFEHPSAEDLSFRTLDMDVDVWSEMPSISESGEQYRPGRTDFVLKYAGPVEALKDVRGFVPETVAA